MLDTETIQKMKQTNISVDGDKTRQRVQEIWKAASKEDRQVILSLAGIKRQTIYTIFDRGTVSAKLAVAMAQTLNVDPRYFTGEAGEPGECSDEIIKSFLIAHGYEKLLTGSAMPGKKPRRKAAAASLPAGGPAALKPNPEPSADIFPLPELTEDDMILLLRSLLLRARAGVPGAAERTEDIKKLLLL